MRTIARLACAAVVAGLLAAFPAMTLAHVELIESSPEAGSNLDTAPTEVTITFDDELDPADSSFTVTNVDGNEVGSGEVDLTVADRNVLRGDVEISDPGVYTVSYSVAGVDGHEIDGTFSFGFNADEEIPEATGGEEHPDTALPAPVSPLATAVGVMLLLAGMVLLGRRLATVR
ncbi:MAG TPA: copper resistance CopC family protein [Candidatus Limnocylindria bacterium]|nr:copper resistance CopC family protein [Candidatus Limnocylindria bacterium]